MKGFYYFISASNMAHRLVLALFTSCFILHNSLAAERDLIIDPLGTGPYAVGSTNFEISESKLSQILSMGLDAGQYQQGVSIDGEMHYISELLALPEESFTFDLQVPDDEGLYGDSAGTTLPYSSYLLYPSTDTNIRSGYQVFIGPELPHMQGLGEAPIFADDNEKYPLIIYSHGAGSHPTMAQLDYLIALASHGYVVLALYHGDNRFMEEEGRRFNLRPLAVKTAIDVILEHQDFKDHIDSNRIGGLGESFGGATMLALLGAKTVDPNFFSVLANSLQSTTIDPRIKAAATIVPFMGKSPYTFFGRNNKGPETVDRPFMANVANMDDQTDYDMVFNGIDNIPGTKYMIEYDMENHAMSEGAVNDAYTWMKVFMDAFIMGDSAQVDALSRLDSVSDSGVDTLVLVTEPETEIIEVLEEVALNNVTATGGNTSTARFSAGAALTGSTQASTTFTSSDTISITGTVFPQTEDIGQPGEIYIVLRTIIDGVSTWTYRDVDGNFQAWDLKIAGMGQAYDRETLSTSESFEIYSGTLSAAKQRIFLGYAIESEDKPVVNVTAIPLTINVSD